MAKKKGKNRGKSKSRKNTTAPTPNANPKSAARVAAGKRAWAKLSPQQKEARIARLKAAAAARKGKPAPPSTAPQRVARAQFAAVVRARAKAGKKPRIPPGSKLGTTPEVKAAIAANPAEPSLLAAVAQTTAGAAVGIAVDAVSGLTGVLRRDFVLSRAGRVLVYEAPITSRTDRGVSLGDARMVELSDEESRALQSFGGRKMREFVANLTKQNEAAATAGTGTVRGLLLSESRPWDAIALPAAANVALPGGVLLVRGLMDRSGTWIDRGLWGWFGYGLVTLSLRVGTKITALLGGEQTGLVTPGSMHAPLPGAKVAMATTTAMGAPISPTTTTEPPRTGAAESTYGAFAQRLAEFTGAANLTPEERKQATGRLAATSGDTRTGTAGNSFVTGEQHYRMPGGPPQRGSRVRPNTLAAIRAGARDRTEEEIRGDPYA